MRRSLGLAVALLVVLAGCSAPLGSSGGGGGSTTGAAGTGTTAASTSETGTTDTGTGSGTTGTGTATSDLADPASDRLGWENGIWYNESLSIDESDGLNASERGAIVNRTMARIEVIRQLEYEEPIPVDVISRETYQSQAGSGEVPPPFRAFDNAKFEAMFFVGENTDSLEVQDRNRGSSVLGYYAPGNDSIVVVSESATPRLEAGTLAHELTHALQDQHFDLTDDPARTRDAYNARNGLIEGEANVVQRRYQERFEDSWATGGMGGSNGSESGGENGSSTQLHYGIYFLEFFPYSDGPGFVRTLYEQGGWDAVNAAHEDFPASAEQVIYPRLYGQEAPTNVTVRDRSSAAWERVRPESPRPGGDQPPYAVLGQSALSSMFAYTLFDVRSGMSYNQSAVVRPGQIINRGEGGQGTNSSDPLNYDLPATQGWDGDKMYVYQNSGDETGYVWKLAWDSPGEAEQFATRYEDLLSHWGGEEVSESGQTSTWEIEGASPFTDAIRVQVNGDRVTITNAPTTEDLNDIHSS
jgi:hypothetical protein